MAVCLVTGGAGFIGSHLVEALVAQGHQVRVLDNFSTGTLENLEKVRSRIELITADLNDAARLQAASEGVELVFHQAALGSAHQGMLDPLAIHHACATGTLQVLLAARKAGVRRIIYAACSSAYGQSDWLPWRETDPIQPQSPYAVAKLAGEHYCTAFTHLCGLETIRLRYFSVFGPRQLPDAQGAVIPRLLGSLLQGESPLLHGDGLQSRDFTFVDDVVQANLLAAQVRRGAGKVYNISLGHQTTLLELVRYANELLGTKIKPLHALARPGELRHSLADHSLAQADLGYCPCVDVKQGLARCLSYLRGEKELDPGLAAAGKAIQGPHQLRSTWKNGEIHLQN